LIRNSDFLDQGVGGRIFYQVWRPEKAPVAGLVLVHGFGEHSGRYENLVPALTQMGIVVYGFDNPGHGKSYGKRGHVDSWKDFDRDLEGIFAFAKSREEKMPWFLFGHSMGGLIALHFVLNRKSDFSGLVVSGPALTQGAVSPVLILASRIMARLWPGFSMDTKLNAQGISRDPKVIERYLNDPLVHSMASARFGVEMAKAISLVKKNAGRLNLPVLVIHGGADPIIPAQTSQELFQKIGSADKTRRVYEGYFHETHNDLGWELPVGHVSQWLGEQIGLASR
jgi:alpha-beta hydrolase superfamily lysophospholipase